MKYNLDKTHADLRKMGFSNNVFVPYLTNDLECLVRQRITDVGLDCGLLNCDIRLGEIDEDAWFDLRKSLHNVIVEWLVTIAVPELARKNALRLGKAAQSQHTQPRHRVIRGVNFVSCTCGFHATYQKDMQGMEYLHRIDYETKRHCRIYSPLDPNIMSNEIHDTEPLDAIEFGKGHCDKCGRDEKPVRILANSRASDPYNVWLTTGNVHLCKGCFFIEMDWRKKRNTELEREAFYVFGWDEPDPAKSPDMVQSYHEENSVDDEDGSNT